MDTEKLIAGIPHIRTPCGWCGELIWAQRNIAYHAGVYCTTCLPELRFGSVDRHDTRGGKRVSHKGEAAS